MRRTKHNITAPIAFARAAFRQLRHIAAHKMTLMAARQNAPLQAVYFHPSFPHPYSVVYRMFHALGVPMKKGIPQRGKQELGFLWKDATFVEAQPGTHLVNGACVDISKEYVEVLHKKVFGYSLEVDPLTHTGLMVSKSNLNGAHDGVTVLGPIAARADDCVYQLVVDNRGPKALEVPDNVCDMRVAIFGGAPAFAYLKYRPKTSRFSNTNSSIRIAELPSILEPAELLRVAEFCKEAGLDYGEIDVVRDYSSGKIYILDINKTPLGPPNGLTEKDRAIALQMYHRAFSAWIPQLKKTNAV
ncbi:hypothetical protein [Janthinobacterium sp.]|uniref:hypothetical protein n=1 Tax=Janthinobacterium sp. TaxID=1871054 RepID=UPI00293D9B3D|nr:hypothetical protein [Janthinobacterium sp.]